MTTKKCKELTKEFLKQVESKSDYHNNLKHNAGRYKYISIYKMEYNDITYYTYSNNKWFTSLESCKKSISLSC